MDFEQAHRTADELEQMFLEATEMDRHWVRDMYGDRESVLPGRVVTPEDLEEDLLVHLDRHRALLGRVPHWGTYYRVLDRPQREAGRGL